MKSLLRKCYCLVELVALTVQRTMCSVNMKCTQFVARVSELPMSPTDRQPNLYLGAALLLLLVARMLDGFDDGSRDD